jgi:predicted transcriptional regulator
MNISVSESDLKLKIISKITSISDREILEEINRIVNSEPEMDAVYELSPEQKLGIEKGLKDVAEGRVYSSEDAQKMLREWQEK